MNTKDIHILPRIICEIGIVSTGIEIGIVSTGIEIGIVSTGIEIGVIITGVNTCPSCDDGLTVGETDGVGVLRLDVVRLGADGVLEAVRVGEARAVACPPCELVPPDDDGLVDDDGLDDVLEAVRLGEARAVPDPPFEAVPVDELLGDGVRVAVLFDLALNLLLL